MFDIYLIIHVMCMFVVGGKELNEKIRNEKEGISSDIADNTISLITMFIIPPLILLVYLGALLDKQLTKE
jgi:hypothetical protein